MSMVTMMLARLMTRILAAQSLRVLIRSEPSPLLAFTFACCGASPTLRQPNVSSIPGGAGLENPSELKTCAHYGYRFKAPDLTLEMYMCMAGLPPSCWFKYSNINVTP